MNTMTFNFRNLATNQHYTKSYIVKTIKQGHDLAQEQCRTCNSVYSATVKIELVR